jgi:uncharacterized protein (DUF362 family)/Pyruvate/2-oxoacid:ferredoxin oxidoreductase delta subunit
MGAAVAICRCDEYEKDEVFKAVHSAVELLGGIGRFVRGGEKVLLKPNMLSAKEPERGITTHPFVLEAMIDEVRSAGGEVWIGDSPSGAIKGIERCWENTGYGALAERTGARLVNFEAGGTVARELGGREFHLARAVFEADVLINLPKFKTHGFTLYTGAIKNLFGTLPGFQKVAVHKLYSHPENFSRVLVDIYAAIRPRLHLMDGIVGMEGNGPSTGDLRKVGLVLASEDGVALDAVASHLMGFKQGKVDAIRIAGERGVGESRIENIDILGESLDAALLDDFKLPSNYLIKLVPQFLVRWAGQLIWVRPYADLDKCTACGVCVKNCPVQAIRMEDGHPEMDYRVCINCLCCNESCPEGAVLHQKSWLAKRVG